MFNFDKYQRYFTSVLAALLFFCIFFVDSAMANIQLTGRDYEYLRKMIFQHECSGNNKNIIVWNEGEEFPSLGLGHFIWYTKSGGDYPYKETFPQLLAYLEAHGQEIPAWIKELPERKAPWATREEFLSKLAEPRVTSLRSLLTRTARLQTSFIAERGRNVLPKLLEGRPSIEQDDIRNKFELVAATKEGLFALIDYTQFKGEGLYESERYQGEGWGLLQVLQQMEMPQNGQEALQEFIGSAKKMLERRVNNSPPERNEKRWLAGWKCRVESYRQTTTARKK